MGLALLKDSNISVPNIVLDVLTKEKQWVDIMTDTIRFWYWFYVSALQILIKLRKFSDQGHRR